MQTPMLTWAHVDKALRTRSVNEPRLADSIQERLHRFDHNPTSERISEQWTGGSIEKGKAVEEGSPLKDYHPQGHTIQKEEVSGNGGYKEASFAIGDERTQTSCRVKEGAKTCQAKSTNPCVIEKSWHDLEKTRRKAKRTCYKEELPTGEIIPSPMASYAHQQISYDQYIQTPTQKEKKFPKQKAHIQVQQEWEHETCTEVDPPFHQNSSKLAQHKVNKKNLNAPESQDQHQHQTMQISESVPIEEYPTDSHCYSNGKKAYQKYSACQPKNNPGRKKIELEKGIVTKSHVSRTAKQDSFCKVGQTSELKGGSENEDDINLEQNSSSAKEEAESDDGFSAATGKDKVKRRSKLPLRHDQRPHPRYRGNDLKKHGIKGMQRKSSISPAPSGSSSPTTSQEDDQNHHTLQGQRKKIQNRRRDSTHSSNEYDDSSSPECDMVSKEESKQLRKVFIRYYGTLCCEIHNPVETAAQLQKKGLIPISMIKDLIGSLKSQQANTLALVETLSNKIKSRPERLFLLIEVLLKIAALRKTGEEILTDIGKAIF